ncbi:M23 family metallopeptidase [Bacillus cereus group sp. BcHK140]|uniref:M23 family metallopeptidase n=1 Tax=Bacillus cereus group sp. BcHK140 TaxID=3018092 RepID=UPI0022E8F8EE|nr:M23 family metallopeptidase [Bacillus cereus group sp. BcHK140]MDA1918303.1 M23 family metallopeptidase [Bacillus cereus group sp. BcHK140]
MATNKETYNLESYKKKIKAGKEEYQKRKEYLAKFELPKTNDEEEEVEAPDASKKPEDQGNAVKEPEGGVGNFTGSGELGVPAEPKSYRFTSVMGARWGTNHNGVDLAPNTPGDTNCKILSAGDGVVLQARSGVGGFGTWIVIKHKDDLYTIYGHMHPNTLKVKTGDTVKRGQHIANMGMQGQSTGVHLHFEVCTDFNNRKGTTKNPEDYVNIRGSASAIQVNSITPKAGFSAKADEKEEGNEKPMHALYENDGAELSEEEKLIDQTYRSSFPYLPVQFIGDFLKKGDMTREYFLLNRVGWARTTKYEKMVPLNKERFIHSEKYDGHEGNLYSPDAKRLFESLLLKTQKPYFEVISGFRFSNFGQLSPHEAGCAIDILVRSIDEVREIADCAWQLGVRSIAIGGDFENNKGFIHIDIAPKGKDIKYDGIPIYGGPGKWVTQ